MEKKPKTEEFSLSNKQWEFLDDETLLIILERSDKLAASSLEQLRNSSDRAYTLFGYLLTVFSGLTAYLLTCDNTALLLPGVVLWAGIGTATGMMFSKVIQVHRFKNVGNEPKNLITEELMQAYKTNEAYRHMLLVAAIEEGQECYETNAKTLKERAAAVSRVMFVIKATVIAIALLAGPIKLLLV